MIATVVAIVGAVVTVASLLISYLAHRHQVQRAAVLDQREARLQAQEERLETRARAVDRRNDLAQASMIETNITVVPSGIHEGSATPHLKIANPSNQPVLDLRITYAGQHITGAPRGLGPGDQRSIPLPVTTTRGEDPTGFLLQLVIDFTDASGTRWRKEGGIGLQQAASSPNGEQRWLPREPPVVGPVTMPSARRADGPPPWAPASPAPAPGPPARRRRRATLLAALLLLAVLAIAIWWLT
ncbi:hypothetical protein [Streptomyces avidinii]|uniref:Uncharacterized protein n=1 Tax=Streptomyces avidinii TaxID=1895 RepID=A0ABS4KXB1_STRAV|nr:hypothetical protein [Streptomyces avidinii]MBP2034672.1 hypothetical protein [Streptomyces avidinii]GGY87962.1 hypothetical protein GCM10010343_11370 [Streptomyces avidinii]